MPPDTPTVKLVLTNTKTDLVAAVAAGVERAVHADRQRREAEQRDSPGAGFDWLPLKKVMEITGWSKATLARRRADGSLPYALVGSSVFIHIDDLRALMERHRRADTSAAPSPAPTGG